MNQKNSLGLNYCFLDLDDPLELFKSWMAEAEKKETRDPTTLSLATASKTGQPDVRMVLLKGLSPKGFVFYTNFNSSKSCDLKENPKAAMCFHWKSFNRQIRILGSVTQVDDREADLYFNSRPYESKISAWASDQSNLMNERSELLKKIEDFKKKYNIIHQCYKKAEYFVNLASSSLSIFKPSKEKNILENLTSFSLERSF